MGQRIIPLALVLTLISPLLAGCLTGVSDDALTEEGLLPLPPALACLASKVAAAEAPATPAATDTLVGPLPLGEPEANATATPTCNALVSNGKDKAAEPHMAVNPKDPNHLVAGAADYGNPLSGPWCGAYVSEDGGASWTRNLLPGFPGDTRAPKGVPGKDNLHGFGYCGDSVIAFGPDGSVYYAGIAFHPPPAYNVALFVAKSTDGGHTWPQVSFVNYGASTVVFNDKEWIAVDPQTGALYITWTLFSFVPVDPLDLSKGDIMFAKSTDGGKTFGKPVKLSTVPFNQGSVPVVTPTGDIVVLWNQFDGEDTSTLVSARSSDGGTTWTKPTSIAVATPLPSPLPNSNFRTALLPGFAVDTSGGPNAGALYAVWNDYATEDSEVLLSVSRDGGATWEAPVVVNSGGNGTDQFMPWVAVDTLGRVQVGYLDRRDDPENRVYHFYVSTSVDGGRTFTDQRMSDAPSDPFAGDSKDALGRTQSQLFIGDYLVVAAGPDGSTYSIWPDLRNAKPGTRIVDLYAERLV